jgi:hypothetical protein
MSKNLCVSCVTIILSSHDHPYSKSLSQTMTVCEMRYVSHFFLQNIKDIKIF